VSIATALIEITELIAGRTSIPSIARAYIPEPQPRPGANAEFGAIALEDGSTGFFYAWLGNSQAGMPARFHRNDFIGKQPEEFVAMFSEPDDAARSIGLAMINAISQHLFRVSRLPMNTDTDTDTDAITDMEFSARDHVGMVGYFPSLIKRLAARGINVSVLERKQHLVGKSHGVEISLDPAALAPCNKILCTGATLLNDTLEDVLQACADAEHIAMIGPTASCLPDPLFNAGIDIVGGTVVNDIDALWSRLPGSRRWGDSVAKYQLNKSSYPGVEKLRLAT
jgi:uncharacterized protein (DUF4213/DUF364 family)